jgi:hypothetical protein
MARTAAKVTLWAQGTPQRTSQHVAHPWRTHMNLQSATPIDPSAMGHTRPRDHWKSRKYRWTPRDLWRDPTPATQVQGKRPPTGGGAIYLQDPHRKPSQVSNGGLGVGGVLGALGEAQDPLLSIAQFASCKRAPRRRKASGGAWGCPHGQVNLDPAYEDEDLPPRMKTYHPR